MKTRIYKWLCLYFYNLWVLSAGVKKPVGIPGNRDPEAPCEVYMPIKKQGILSGDCETDGHYLCDKCIHNIKNAWPDPPEESEGIASL